MDSISAEKCSIAWFEYWMVLSSWVHWLGWLVFVSFWCFLLIEAVCAIAARFGPAEVPMIVPKMMGPGIAMCFFGLLLLDLVSQVSSSWSKTRDCLFMMPSWVRLMRWVMGQEMGLSLQIWFWIEIAFWDSLMDSMSLSSMLPRFIMYVSVNVVASKMIRFSPLFRVENASGSAWLFDPFEWVGLKAPFASGIAALAAVQWRRMMNNMHQPIPFSTRVLISLNSSFMSSSMEVKSLSTVGFFRVLFGFIRFLQILFLFPGLNALST